MQFAPALGEFGGVIDHTLDTVGDLRHRIGNGCNTSRGERTEIYPASGGAHGDTDDRRIVVVHRQEPRVLSIGLHAGQVIGDARGDHRVPQGITQQEGLDGRPEPRGVGGDLDPRIASR